MHKLTKLVLPLALAALLPLGASAQMLPGAHPGYLHALTDLRTARWLLEHQPGDARVYGDEDVAVTEIDGAIGEIKRASIDDGKDLHDHPAVDVREHGSRLLKSIETLEKARADITKEEDNPQTLALRRGAYDHIEHAIQAAGRAHAQWLRDVRG